MSENVQMKQMEISIYDTLFAISRVDFPVDNNESQSSEIINNYHYHFYYEIHVVIAGTAEIFHEGKSYRITCGELFIIPPHSPHFSIFQSNVSTQNIVLCMTLEKCEGNACFYEYFRKSLEENVYRPIPLSPELLYQIISLHASLHSNRFRDLCRQYMLASEVLISIFDQMNGLQYTLPRQPEQKLEAQVQMELERCINSARKYSLTQIAEKLGYSTRQTARLIEKLYGKNLQELRRNNAIATVKHLLLDESEKPLHQIAAEVGFSRVHTMNRVFYDEVGVNPIEYRNQNLKLKQKGQQS